MGHSPIVMFNSNGLIMIDRKYSYLILSVIYADF